NALAHRALPVTQAQYGASLGGPIVSGRTFYFGNFEQRELNQSCLITIAPADVATINSRLSAVGYPGPLIYADIYPNPVHTATSWRKWIISSIREINSPSVTVSTMCIAGIPEGRAG